MLKRRRNLIRGRDQSVDRAVSRAIEAFGASSELFSGRGPDPAKQSLPAPVEITEPPEGEALDVVDRGKQRLREAVFGGHHSRTVDVMEEDKQLVLPLDEAPLEKSPMPGIMFIVPSTLGSSRYFAELRAECKLAEDQLSLPFEWSEPRTVSFDDMFLSGSGLLSGRPDGFFADTHGARTAGREFAEETSLRRLWPEHSARFYERAADVASFIYHTFHGDLHLGHDHFSRDHDGWSGPRKTDEQRRAENLARTIQRAIETFDVPAELFGEATPTPEKSGPRHILFKPVRHVSSVIAFRRITGPSRSPV